MLNISSSVLLYLVVTQLFARASVTQEDLIDLMPQLDPQSIQTKSKNSDVEVTFFGVSTLLFKTASTALLVDGFYSRPDISLFKKIEPDRKIIKRALKGAGIQTCVTGEQRQISGEVMKLDAVVVVHSHYDHAMDVAEVAALTGARVLGSESTREIVGASRENNRFLNCAEFDQHSDMDKLVVGDPMRYEDLTLTVYPALHVWTLVSPLLNGKISESFSTPARTGKYKEGGVYGLKIEAGGNTILVHASARCPESEAPYPGIADIVFLGIGGLGFKSPKYLENYWECMVENTMAKQVYAIHWDDFTGPLTENGLRTSKFADIPRILGFFSELDGKDKRLRLPPVGEPFSLTGQ